MKNDESLYEASKNEIYRPWMRTIYLSGLRYAVPYGTINNLYFLFEKKTYKSHMNDDYLA